MPLPAGARLGPYEILAPLGTGGMGEVYRARDTRLHREVAIKVANAEFSERFSREARSIAALNHSNVCHLYDVGPNYLVLEYVEGWPEPQHRAPGNRSGATAASITGHAGCPGRAYLSGGIYSSRFAQGGHSRVNAGKRRG